MEEGSCLSAAQPAAKQQVLIVEDDPITRTVFSHVITGHGCTVHIAGSAREATEQLRLRTYDLILVDANLPDSHGVEIVRAVRRHGSAPRTPIVAVSSDDGRDNVRLLLESGVDEFVVKPVTAQTLGDLLGRWLGTSRG